MTLSGPQEVLEGSGHWREAVFGLRWLVVATGLMRGLWEAKHGSPTDSQRPGHTLSPPRIADPAMGSMWALPHLPSTPKAADVPTIL